jgi:hypothetical protein
MSSDKAPELHALAVETGVLTSLCDFHAIKAIGDALVGHAMPELAAVMAVAFKCVRRSITGTTLDAATDAFEHFATTRLRQALPYLVQSDVDWVGG